MGYLVNLTARAERDLGDLYDEKHSRATLSWYLGFKEAILTLENHPKRCPLTPESDKFRHLLYGNFGICCTAKSHTFIVRSFASWKKRASRSVSH